MAACGAMSLQRPRVGSLRTTVIASRAWSATGGWSAGCSKCGRRSRGRWPVPRSGATGAVADRAGGHRAASSRDCRPAMPNAASSSVPVDYTKPDGDVAQLAMIRFKATGEKIGSLVINPGGPGESGVEAAVSIVESLPTPVRERFDLVGFDPRGVGVVDAGGVVQLRRRQRPAARRPPGRLHARRRRAHRERDQGVRRSAASTRWARSSWPTSAPPTSPRISTRSAPRSATTS